jgi:hypothetical protein
MDLTFDEFEFSYLAFGLAVGQWGVARHIHSGLNLESAIGYRRQNGFVRLRQPGCKVR